MIAAVCWVPKGVAKAAPISVDPPSAEEIQSLLQLHHGGAAETTGSPAMSDDDGDDELVFPEEQMDGGSRMVNNAVATALAAAHALGCDNQNLHAQLSLDDVADELAELDMDNYDNEDEGVELFGNGGLGAAYYSSNDLDPYLTNKDSEDEEEIEDMTIKPLDLLILTARNEDDVSHLEVWVYEDETEDGSHNMYVHHDIMLPAFPLSLAWLDCDPKGGQKGNYVAVGSMQSEIELWDLDLLDAVEPAIKLGGYIQISSGKQRKKNKNKKEKVAKLKEGSHSDAVLSLAWNTEYRNVLASASADFSVKIWDIVTQQCEHTIHSHSDKVQAVAWNVFEPTVLLSGSFDHTVSLLDMKAPAHEGIKFLVSADVENLAWNPHTAFSFVVSLEDGTVCGHDIRSVSSAGASGCPSKGSKTLFTINAHDKAVCTVSYNTAAPDLLATGSTDKMVKLWDIKDNHPVCICSKNLAVGAVFAASFCKDSPFLLALGGSTGNLEVWDTITEAEVMQRFGKFGQQRPLSKSGGG